MLAELHGKLSEEPDQGLERLEDLLTEYVFGSLRNLDRRCLMAVLDAAVPGAAWSDTDYENASFAFWPQLPGGTEPDAVIAIGRDLLIIEAKLHSGFAAGGMELDDQLVREWRHGVRWAAPRKLQNVVVVAITPNYSEPPEVAAANSLITREFGAQERVKWLSWQSIAQLLEANAGLLPSRDQSLVADLLAVMERRGVRRVFKGFNQEDYWVLAAGTRIGADRIFPAIKTFAEELYEECAIAGLERGTTDRRIVTTRSESLGKPRFWGVTHINIPLWNESWPKRNKAIHAILFAQFPLTEPVLRVGFRIRINRNRRDSWHSYVPQLVDGLRASTGGHELAVMTYPDLVTAEERLDAAEVTADWLNGVIDRAEKYLAIQRTLPLDELTQTAVVRDMLLEDRAFIEATLPSLLHEAALA